MRAQTISILLLLTVTAMIIGFYIAPSHREVALMHLDDSDYDEALNIYSRLRDQGDNSIGVIMPLANLYVHFGNTNKAIDLLKIFVAKHPSSLDANKQLANLYKASQRLYDYCGVLEDLQKISPSVEWLRKLADIYDFLGDYPKEQSALKRLLKNKDYKPREDDYVKLAILDRDTGRNEDAIDAITSGLEEMHYKVSTDTIHLAIQLLLEKDQSARALSIANNYLKTKDGEEDAIIFSSLFQSYDKFDMAYEVLAPYLADIDKSPDLEIQYVSVLLAQKKNDEVFSLLSRQFAENDLPVPLTQTLIDEAARRKDIQFLESVIKTSDLQAIPENALLQYADLTFRLKRPDIAQLIRKRLGDGFLRQTPLLLAVLNVVEHGSAGTVKALADIPDEHIATQDEKMVVAGILIEFGETARAAALLDNVPMDSILEILDPPQIARLCLDTNQAEKCERKLNDIPSPVTSPTLHGAYDETRLDLAAGEGKQDVVQAWLKENSSVSEPLLSDAIYIANHYHHDALALDIARRAYELASTPENLLQFSDALMANQRYGEALKLLGKPAQQDGAARQMFIDALAGWISRPDFKPDEFDSIVNAQLGKLNLSTDEKRSIAYELENAGYRELAQGYFVDLASNQPFGSRDVDELLGFWDDDLSDAAINWIINRARNADPDEKAKWLAYLNDSSHSDAVAALLNDDDDLSPALTEVYANALINTHQTDRLKMVLENAIDDEQDENQLAHYAKLAEGENLSKTSEKAWRLIYDMDPQNEEAGKELGLAAFDDHRYAEAKQFLKQYLNDTDGDYRTNFAYAEILKQDKKKEQAAAYYKRALDQIDAIQDKGPQVLADQARLLYLNGQTNNAIDLCRMLLADDPDNKGVRADLAEILIQSKRYKEASALLGQ